MGGLALSTAGCRREPPPSPEYEQAFERYLALRKDARDAVFLDPEMDEVLEQLATVDPGSRDARAASELTNTILQGQERARAHQAELEAMRGVANRPVEIPPSREEPPPDAEPVVENPVEETPQPTYGMTVAQLREQLSRCFEPGEAMHIPGKGLRDIWVLKDLQVCRDLHPKYVKDVVLLESGKVWGTATPGERIEFPADAGAAPQTGSGDGAAEAAPAPTPAPKAQEAAAPSSNP